MSRSISSDEFREKYLGEMRDATSKPLRGGRTSHLRGVMNATEASYAQMLEVKRLCGEIGSWYFESVTFSLGDPASGQRCTYTPDFFITLADGRWQVHEVKGHMEDDAAVKMKWFVQKFGQCRLFLVKRETAGFSVKEYAKGRAKA